MAADQNKPLTLSKLENTPDHHLGKKCDLRLCVLHISYLENIYSVLGLYLEDVEVVWEIRLPRQIMHRTECQR